MSWLLNPFSHRLDYYDLLGVGQVVPGGIANTILYADSTGALDSNTNLGWNESKLSITPADPSSTIVNVAAGKVNPTPIDPATLTADIYAWFTQDGLSSQVDGTYAPTWTSTVGEPIVLSTWSGVDVKKDPAVINGYAHVTTYPRVGAGGMQNYGAAPTALAQPFTVVFVGATFEASGLPMVSFSATPYGSPYVWSTFATPTSYTIIDGAISTTSTGGVKTKFSTVTAIYDTNLSVFVRGLQDGLSPASPGTGLSNVSLFSQSYAGGASIAEVIIFKKALSQAEREGVESWLCAKYGLSYNAGTQQTGDLLKLTNAIGDNKFVVNKDGKLTQYAEKITDTIWEPSVLGETYPRFSFSGQRLWFGDGTQSIVDTNTGNRNWCFQSFNSGINLLPSSNSPAGTFTVRTPGGTVALVADPLYGKIHTPKMSVSTSDTTPEANIDVENSGATQIGIIVKGAAAQSANLQEWQDSSATPLAFITPAGIIQSGNAQVYTAGDFDILKGTSTNGTVVQATIGPVSLKGPSVQLNYNNSETGALTYFGGGSTAKFMVDKNGNTDVVGYLRANVNSTTGLLIEQDGVKDNVLVVDTTNGRVGINSASGGPVLNIQGGVTNTQGVYFGQVVTSSGGHALISSQAGMIPTAAPTNPLYGMLFVPTIFSSSNNITTLYPMFARVDTDASYTGNIVNINSYFAAAPSLAGSGTVTRWRGFMTADVSVGTSQNAAFMGQLSVGTNKWNAYMTGTADNYFGGRVGIGDQTPLADLEIGVLAATDVGIAVRGASSQSANLTEWRDSTDAVLSSVDAAGNISAPRLVSPMASITVAASATTFAVAGNSAKITGDAGANTVATITGGVSGQVLTLLFVDALVTITDTAAATTDTIDLSAAFTSAANTTLTLIHDGTKWYETARSVN